MKSQQTLTVSPNSKEHLGWVDLIRIIACFLVVVAHSCDAFVLSTNEERADHLIGSLIGSFVRPCVPLFAMISGVLLFPVRMEMGAFYSKKLKRLLIPLVIWSLALPLLFFGLFQFNGGVTSNALINSEMFTWSATVDKITTFWLNFNYDTTPLWYLYMLVGVYLIIPIIAPWLHQAKQKDIKTFLYIWGASLLLPTIQLVAPMLGLTGYENSVGILGVCSWNAFNSFYYFSGFLGYVILAYYLKTYPLHWSWSKTLAICVPLFLVGYAITLYGFLSIFKAYPGDVDKLEITWWFCSINVFMMTFSLYVILSKVRINSGAFMRNLAALTLGIFLCHFVIVQAVYDFFITYLKCDFNAFIMIPLIAVVTFILSYLFSWILSLNPITRKSVM